jgi:hypothetical protein
MTTILVLLGLFSPLYSMAFGDGRSVAVQRTPTGIVCYVGKARMEWTKVSTPECLDIMFRMIERYSEDARKQGAK